MCFLSKTKNVFCSLICILFSFNLPFHLLAQATDTIAIDEVVVSATKTLVNRNQVPLTISVISSKVIDESGESSILPILSERIPGLFVTERGVTGFGIATGAAGALNIRGVGGGNKVLMLFDGQPQWAGIFGHHLPDTYSNADADRVEVVRGPASLLYGSNAMGGVVNIITRKAKEDGLHGRGRLLYGSYNTQKYMINVGGKKGKFNSYLSLNYDRTDGHRENSEFNIVDGYAKVGYEFSSHWNASSDAILAYFTTNNPGTEQAPLIDSWANALRGTCSFSLENSYERASGAVQAFYNFGRHKVNDGWLNGQPRPIIFNSNDYNAGLTLYESLRLFKGNLITLGFDYKTWGGHAWNDSVNSVGTSNIIDKNVYEGATYLLIQQTLASKWTLNAGARLEMNETYGAEWVPQVGVVFRATHKTDLKASISKGFRSPNIRELYMYGPVANPDLKPESMVNFECSILQRMLDGKLALELNAFVAKGKNMIQVVKENGQDKNKNVGKFINTGFEFAGDYRVLPTLELNANYSFLHTDTPILAAPKHQAFFNVAWSISRFTIASSLQYVGDLYTKVGDNPQTENYLLLNGKISCRLYKWLSLFFNGDNLTNQSYTINYGFPMPGVVFMGGIDFKF